MRRSKRSTRPFRQWLLAAALLAAAVALLALAVSCGGISLRSSVYHLPHGDVLFLPRS